MFRLGFAREFLIPYYQFERKIYWEGRVSDQIMKQLTHYKPLSSIVSMQVKVTLLAFSGCLILSV
jgi:hypothetical protein